MAAENGKESEPEEGELPDDTSTNTSNSTRPKQPPAGPIRPPSLTIRGRAPSVPPPNGFGHSGSRNNGAHGNGNDRLRQQQQSAAPAGGVPQGVPRAKIAIKLVKVAGASTSRQSGPGLGPRPSSTKATLLPTLAAAPAPSTSTSTAPEPPTATDSQTPPASTAPLPLPTSPLKSGIKIDLAAKLAHNASLPAKPSSSMHADSIDHPPESQSLADRLRDPNASQVQGGLMPRQRSDGQLERRTSAGNGADLASLLRWDHQPDRNEPSGSSWSKNHDNRDHSPPPPPRERRSDEFERSRRLSDGSSYRPSNTQASRGERGDWDRPMEKQYQSGDRDRDDRGHHREPRGRHRDDRPRSRSRSRDRSSRPSRNSRTEASDVEDEGERRRQHRSHGSGAQRRGEPEPHTRRSGHSNSTRPRSGSDGDVAPDSKRRRRSPSPSSGPPPGAVRPPKVGDQERKPAPSRSPPSPVSSQGTPERKMKVDDGTPPPRIPPVPRRSSDASQDVKPKPDIKPSQSSTSGRLTSRSPSRDDRHVSSSRRDDYRGPRRDGRDESKRPRDDRRDREGRHDRRDYDDRGPAPDSYRPSHDRSRELLHSRRRSRSPSPTRRQNAYGNYGPYGDPSRQQEYCQGPSDGQGLDFNAQHYGPRAYPAPPIEFPPTKLPEKDERGEVKIVFGRPQPTGPAAAAAAPARDLDGMLAAAVSKPQPPQGETPPRPNTHTRGPQGIPVSYSTAPIPGPVAAPPPLVPTGPRSHAERERERPAPAPVQAPHAPPHPTISAEGSQAPSRTTTPHYGAPAPTAPSAPRSMVATTRRSQSSAGRLGPMGALFLDKVTPLPTGAYDKIYAAIKNEAPKPHVYVGSSPVSAYDLAEKLGEGTFGVVWKATRKAEDAGKAKKGAVVALKEIILHNEGDGMPITSLREIRILKELDHPNVVPVVDMVYEQGDRKQFKLGKTFMVFPYMDHDLAGLLENRDVILNESHIKQYSKQLLQGTAYLHQNKILHRDMKAANLLINNEGVLMIADFGLARSIHKAEIGRDYTNCVVTRWYRPPELLLGEKKYHTPVDMWGVGCVIAEMFHRTPIFPGSSDMNQAEQIFTMCGTPNEQNMPGLGKLPGCDGHKNWGHKNRSLNRRAWEWCQNQIFVDLMEGILLLDPKKRLTAAQALDHEWFWSEPLPEDPKNMPKHSSSHEMDKRTKDEAHFAKQQQNRPVVPFQQPPTHAPYPQPAHPAQTQQQNAWGQQAGYGPPQGHQPAYGAPHGNGNGIGNGNFPPQHGPPLRFDDRGNGGGGGYPPNQGFGPRGGGYNNNGPPGRGPPMGNYGPPQVIAPLAGSAWSTPAANAPLQGGQRVSLTTMAATAARPGRPGYNRVPVGAAGTARPPGPAPESRTMPSRYEEGL